MTALEQYIQATLGVAEADLATISSLFKPVQLKKGDHFLRAGRRSERLGFVQEGLLREYAMHGQKEVTKWISTPGYFAVDLSSFLFDRPARWTIEALADTELHVIERADYGRIGTLVPDWPELEKRFIAKCFTVLEERVLMHLALTAAERYKLFFEHNKALFNQAPLQHLASMLGMAPETLSRLRARSDNEA
jgi:CRP/FNR family transcriptional regulator, anaerobic regulatory protein